ncbi:cell cycle checkpoint protein RAD1-like [Anopheles aquasalis]|uniref:cell cycle checkpoint protein RAD1-like n=1 Tax=Anopheles aquasalis TaxID=42839 RepID=UPI00215AA399|nr:cell cycle checkpoint protein RAD1-like [Anopheles aquasalis]
MQRTKVLLSKGIVHNRNMVTQTQYSQIQFQAVVNNLATFHNVIKAINFVENAMIQLSKEGLQVTVEDAKSIQAVALIKRTCFSEYSLNAATTATAPAEGGTAEPFASFGLNLKVFTDCLSMFTTSELDSSLKLLRKGPRAPLIAILEQHGEDSLITECSIRTMEPFDCMDLEFTDDQQIVSKFAAKGTDFFQLLGEMDSNCAEIEVSITPSQLKFETFGELHMNASVELSNDSDILISFNCSQTSTYRYKFQHFKLIMRTLALASQVVISTNGEGLLGLQVIIENNDNSMFYVQYFILPLVHDNDSVMN